MHALLRAEARKILTTPSTILIAGVALLYPVLSVLPAVLAADEPVVDQETMANILRGGADVLILIALVLGILSVASEHRHGTIVPSLLATPQRRRFMTAKLASQAALGAVLGVAVSAIGLVTGTAYFITHDALGEAHVLSGDVLLTVAAATLVVTLYAVMGTAVGALVKNQTAGVAGALLWVLTVENAIPIVLHNPGLKRWMPGGLGDRLLHAADPAAGSVSAWLALGLFVAVVALLSGAAYIRINAADID